MKAYTFEEKRYPFGLEHVTLSLVVTEYHLGEVDVFLRTMVATKLTEFEISRMISKDEIKSCRVDVVSYAFQQMRAEAMDRLDTNSKT